MDLALQQRMVSKEVPQYLLQQRLLAVAVDLVQTAQVERERAAQAVAEQIVQVGMQVTRLPQPLHKVTMAVMVLNLGPTVVVAAAAELHPLERTQQAAVQVTAVQERLLL